MITDCINSLGKIIRFLANDLTHDGHLLSTYSRFLPENPKRVGRNIPPPKTGMPGRRWIRCVVESLQKMSSTKHQVVGGSAPTRRDTALPSVRAVLHQAVGLPR